MEIIRYYMNVLTGTIATKEQWINDVSFDNCNSEDFQKLVLDGTFLEVKREVIMDKKTIRTISLAEWIEY